MSARPLASICSVSGPSKRRSCSSSCCAGSGWRKQMRRSLSNRATVPCGPLSMLLKVRSTWAMSRLTSTTPAKLPSAWRSARATGITRSPLTRERSGRPMTVPLALRASRKNWRDAMFSGAPAGMLVPCTTAPCASLPRRPLLMGSRSSGWPSCRLNCAAASAGLPASAAWYRAAARAGCARSSATGRAAGSPAPASGCPRSRRPGAGPCGGCARRRGCPGPAGPAGWRSARG